MRVDAFAVVACFLLCRDEGWMQLEIPMNQAVQVV